MDYRHRKYYLVSLPWFSKDMRLQHFRIAAPSMKMHPPYNHVLSEKPHPLYDGHWRFDTGVCSPGMMLSCKLEDAGALEYELRKMVRNDSPHASFFELTKSFCKQ